MATTNNDQGHYTYVSYPREADIKFDSEYYLNKHLAIVDTHWKQYGMKSWTVVEFPEGDASGLHTQAILLFDSAEGFKNAMAANIPEVMEDIKNYSNVMPVIYSAKVLRQG